MVTTYRLIIEFEWGSLYINLRRSGMVSSKNSTRAHETTNLQITSVVDMAERIATTTVMLFWYANTGAKCILNSSIGYLMLYNQSSTHPFAILLSYRPSVGTVGAAAL